MFVFRQPGRAQREIRYHLFEGRSILCFIDQAGFPVELQVQSLPYDDRGIFRNESSNRFPDDLIHAIAKDSLCARIQ